MGHVHIKSNSSKEISESQSLYVLKKSLIEHTNQ